MMPDGPFLIQRDEWRWVLLVAACVVLLASIPYVAVYFATPPDLRFVGTLINPLDGDTYLAKMQAGAQGDWLFHLPYTAQSHPGVLLLTHYLALGHVAAWTRLPVPLVYHLARVAAGFALLVAVYALIARLVQGRAERRLAFLFVALSSGFGWLAAMAGNLNTSDLVIPESNTFYSLNINPHFPLAIALMIGLLAAFVCGPARFSPRRPAALAVLSLALAIVQPFAVVTTYLTLGVYLLVRAWRDRRVEWGAVQAAFIGGLATLPLLAYSLWVTQADPVLRGWMAQNVTPSPPLWNYVLGYGLVLALAVPGAVRAARRRGDGDLMLLAWAGVTALLLYAPFALQRRFSLGLHVPLAILAAMGVGQIVHSLPAGRVRWLPGAALALTLPTTLLVLLLGLGGGLQHDPRLFVSADEAAALDWMRESAPLSAAVVASPQMGLFVPAWSGRRVVYGHPFETVDAERTEARVETFFAAGTGQPEREAMLRDWGATLVFFGPRERALGLSAAPPGRMVFQNATVTVFEFN